jgi:UDP-N-acetylmuramate--alanine ligase
MKRLHFIGLGGIGMSGIARMHLDRGDAVQGSDVKKGPILEDLEKRGAKVFVGHEGAYVEGADLVVYSTAVKGTHPERVEAMRRGIPVIHRSQALAALCQGKTTLAVAGTHGKTTTTALVGMILREAGKDPSIVVGGWVEDIGGNAVTGHGKEIVIEADESDSSFLRFTPQLAVVTNIEPEHLDHFGSAQRMEKAFEDFIDRIPQDGKWFGCAEDPGVRALAAKMGTHCVLYGFGKREGLWAQNIVECPGGKRGVSFEVWHGNEKLGGVTLRLLGRHNVLNALGAIGMSLAAGVPFAAAAKALAKFTGTDRRFDVKFEDERFLVVDDYAHHPTEIAKTLEALRKVGSWLFSSRIATAARSF